MTALTSVALLPPHRTSWQQPKRCHWHKCIDRHVHHAGNARSASGSNCCTVLQHRVVGSVPCPACMRMVWVNSLAQARSSALRPQVIRTNTSSQCRQQTRQRQQMLLAVPAASQSLPVTRQSNQVKVQRGSINHVLAAMPSQVATTIALYTAPNRPSSNCSLTSMAVCTPYWSLVNEC